MQDKQERKDKEKVVSIPLLDLKPVEVRFEEYKPVKIQLNDKIPDLLKRE